MMPKMAGSSPSAVGSRSPIRVGLAFTAWFIAALVVGATGLLERAPVPPPAFAIVLAAAVLLLLWLAPAIRETVRGIGLKPLVGFHLTRLIAGAYFLLLYRRGILPGEFALAAGWGDIAVAAAAILVLWLCLPIRTQRQRLGLLLWNTAGLVDILGVLANGARLFLDNPPIGASFTALPLVLLPTFVVPIVLVSHVLIFAWTPPRTV